MNFNATVGLDRRDAGQNRNGVHATRAGPGARKSANRLGARGGFRRQTWPGLAIWGLLGNSEDTIISICGAARFKKRSRKDCLNGEMRCEPQSSREVTDVESTTVS
jgi:hypothetical protein